jgi:hypothetical protein
LGLAALLGGDASSSSGDERTDADPARLQSRRLARSIRRAHVFPVAAPVAPATEEEVAPAQIEQAGQESAPAEAPPAASDLVPQTMADVYKLSNRSRKHKDKKRAKEDEGRRETGEAAEEAEGAEDTTAGAGKRARGAASSMEFLGDVGFLPRQPKEAQQAAKPAAAPFDYTESDAAFGERAF